MTVIVDEQKLSHVVKEVVQQQKITDMHTHLYAPNFDRFLFWNVDEMLTYHYFAAEFMRWSSIDTETFWGLSKREQAALIWKELFVNRSPLSETCRGLLTSLQALGIDTEQRDLDVIRHHFETVDLHEHVDRVLDLAHVEHVVMTNDPFDDQEREIWLSGAELDPRFHAALRLDPLLNDFRNTAPKLRSWGYDVQEEWNDRTAAEINRFLNDWIRLMNPVYVAVSLPGTFTFPDHSIRGQIIENCILPTIRKAGLPFALMIGVKRQVNPALQEAGDYVEKASMDALQNLLVRNPQNKFFVTMLSRENQHELVVLARKFRNLMVFGCWWFMNNPVIINEVTRMRMEMLGTSFIPQHSDARVLEQLLYKWSHSKQIIAEVLIDKYKDILRAGWRIEQADITRDVEDLFHNNFWNFVRK
jgi:hypothetical protein